MFGIEENSFKVTCQQIFQSYNIQNNTKRHKSAKPAFCHVEKFAMAFQRYSHYQFDIYKRLDNVRSFLALIDNLAFNVANIHTTSSSQPLLWYRI